MDKVIGIDTMVFIYHIEEHPVYCDITEDIPKRCKNYPIIGGWHGEKTFICDTYSNI